MIDVDPGDLNKLMTIQARSAAKGSQGGQNVSWSDVTDVWVRIRPATSNIMKSARESFAASAQQTESLNELVIRYLPGITGAHRGLIKADGRVFNFGRPINVDEQNEWLVIPGAEGMNNG